MSNVDNNILRTAVEGSSENLENVEDEEPFDDDHIVDINVRFPAITCRSSPAALVGSMKSMTEKQRNDVVDMGFGQLFHIDVIEIPTRMGYWVLDNFDARTSEISLQDNRRIHIDASDVHRVFGLPLGGVPIQNKKKFDQCQLLKDWKMIFGNENARIVVKEVAKKMMELKDGGEWFKRHFLVLVTACLIESNTNGYLAPQIMSYFDDLSKVKGVDWCDYLMRSLVKHKVMWEKNKKKYFTGPILFITALYVDRVVLYNRSVAREFPTIKNWTHLLMKKRENAEIKLGAFGGGYPHEPVKVKIEQIEANNSSDVIEVKKTSHVKTSQYGANNLDTDIDMYAEKFIQTTKLLAVNMVNIIALVEGAPQQFKGNELYKKMVGACHQLLGCIDVASTSSSTPAQTQFLDTHAEDEFWADAGRLAEIEEIEKAMAKRNEFVKITDDGPSFSLGLTQDGWGGVDNVMRDINFMNSNSVDETETLVIRSPMSEGVELHKNIHIGGEPQEKQILPKIHKVVRTSDGIPFELEQDQHGRFVSAGKAKEKIGSVGHLPNEKDIENNEVEVSNARGKKQIGCVGHLPNEKDIENNEVEVSNARGKKQGKKVKCVLKLGKQKVQIGDPETHHMERRNKANLKKTGLLLSPYIERVINLSAKLSNTEKTLWFWIFHNKNADPEEIVFDSGSVEIRRRVMATMRGDCEIGNDILDAWSTIMNHKKMSRSLGSTYRFFATTKLNILCDQCFCIAEDIGPLDSPERLEMFVRAMDDEIKNAKGVKLSDIELFVFPIYQNEHFQIVCFNVKKFRWDVIDNKISSGVVDSFVGSSVVFLLADYFVSYLDCKGLSGKATGLTNAECNRLDLPCRGNPNNFDCWVYVMRHMKTYMGEGLKNWKCGLRANGTVLLMKTRVRYVAEILSTKINLMKERNMKESGLYYRVSNEDGTVNIDKLLLNN
ncbi:hypothetical protein C2S52_019674 [Perilla frutescens var. hirtella]|nr:hypothetical protein C2S52_019674 [Perilla frutescens var. hirtella]